MGKVYAVKVGRTPGIYSTWVACLAQVNKYPGAIYKSFATVEEAKEYMKDKISDKVEIMPLQDLDAEEEKKKNPFDSDEIKCIAFCDGSFNSELKKYGGGYFLYIKSEKLFLVGMADGNNKDDVPMRNVAGELLAARGAINAAIRHGCESIHLFYDYKGIECWAKGEWKTNKPGTKKYKKEIDEMSEVIEINFRKVKAHSNNKYNDLVDLLAKKACDVEFTEDLIALENEVEKELDHLGDSES